MNIVENLLASASTVDGELEGLTVVSSENLEALRDATPTTFLELALEGLEKDLNTKALSMTNAEKLQQAILAVEQALDLLQ